MIKRILMSAACISAVILFTFCSDKEITCVIKGKVIRRDSDTLYLQKATEDPRFVQTKIPIKDSLFEYKLVIPVSEAYMLVFADELKNGSWRPITIFPENGEVNCVLYPQNEFEKNKITGGDLNAQYSDYMKTITGKFLPMAQALGDSAMHMMERKEYYSPAMDNVRMELDRAKDNETRNNLYRKIRDLETTKADLSEAGRALRDEEEALKRKADLWKYDFIEKNSTIVSYYLLLQDLQSVMYYKPDLDAIRKNVDVLAKKFPDHPYASITKYLIDSQDKIKVGGTYIDFTLPDIDGKMFTLSEIIKDKIALIDLWASWCGSCITTSRSMIPVYEEFKDKGFTVCGVAAEVKNTNAMKNRIEKDKVPWKNLVDLDNKNLIWYKYGVPNSGGGTFLVDKDGKILAVNPTAEEVRNILLTKLK